MTAGIDAPGDVLIVFDVADPVFLRPDRNPSFAVVRRTEKSVPVFAGDDFIGIERIAGNDQTMHSH